MPEPDEKPASQRGRSRLVMPAYAGFKGLRVENTFDIVGPGPEWGFHVQVEDEIYFVRTICGHNLLYVESGKRGTKESNHPVGAEVIRLPDEEEVQP